MTSRIASACCTVLTLSATGVAAFQCIRDVDRLSGGLARGVVVTGNTAAVGSGSRLVIFDVSNPIEPRATAELSMGPVPPTGSTCVEPLATVDRFAVVSESCGERARLQVVDLSEPTAPDVAGFLELSGRAEHAVTVGGIAWVAVPVASGGASRDTMLALDLARPDDPLVVGGYQSGRLHDAAAEGDLLGVLESLPPSYTPTLTLLDVRSPSSPTVLSRTAVSSETRLVEFADGRAYLATDSTITVLDLDDPASPSTASVTSWQRLAGPADLLAAGDRLLLGLLDVDPMIAEPGGGLEVFELADPSSSASRQSIVFSSGGSDLAASDGRLLVADRARGLRVFQLDQLASPLRTGLVNPTLDAVSAVVVEGDLAILADHGLRTVDLDAPGGPVVLGGLDLDLTMVYDPDGGMTCETRRSTWDVDANPEGLAVLAASGGVLVVVDLSDPQHPVELGRIELEHLASSPTRVALSGSRAAVVGYTTEGLALLDLSDPAHPIELGRGVPSGGASAVALVGDHAVVAFGPWDSGSEHHGLDVFDVSDPAAPVVVGSIELARPVTALASLGSLVVGAGREGLSLVDLTDPAAPDEIGSLDSSLGTVSGIATAGTRAYVASRPGSLAVFDLAFPEHPRLVGRTTWQPFTVPDGGPTGGYGVAMHEGRAVVADGTFGVRVLDSRLCFDRPQVPHGHAWVE